MKTHRTVLVSIYIFLALLFLLLCLLRGCNREAYPAYPAVPEAAAPAPSEEAINDQARQVGHDGRLKITLLWDFPGDVDLHVKEPNNFEIFYSNSVDLRTGGYLDVDNRVGGIGSAENIYWDTPPAGHYIVSLVYFAATGSHTAGGPCTVVVKRDVNGSPKTEQFVVNVSRPSVRHRIPVTEFNLY